MKFVVVFFLRKSKLPVDGNHPCFSSMKLKNRLDKVMSVPGNTLPSRLGWGEDQWTSGPGDQGKSEMDENGWQWFGKIEWFEGKWMAIKGKQSNSLQLTNYCNESSVLTN